MENSTREFLNSSHSSGHPHHVNSAEGGFLSGRNPFLFIPSAPLPTFIIQLVIIICLCRIVKFLLSPVRQPNVIAEIISGIILGPTGCGQFKVFTDFVFPAPSIPFLNLMANFGLVLFLFLVGLELDPKVLRKSLRRSFTISLAGMALPFATGVGVSYALLHLIEPETNQTAFTTYLLFLGVAMSITAFPVLARILTELDLLKTKVGSITISAAAVDDATSWCLLALVISLINSGTALVALYVFAIGLAYALLLVLVGRPLLIWYLNRHEALDGGLEPRQSTVFIIMIIVFASAFITDAIGIHAIFGGFLAGIIIPHEGGFAFKITHKIEDLVTVLFLPLYFTLSGLKTSIGSLDEGVGWAMVVLIIFVACFGKICGCTLAARASNMNWRESLAVGCLMNCKGLVELIVLNLGYDAGVISQKTFAIMVIMALVTTFITVPAVRYVYPPEYQGLAESGPEQARGNSHSVKYSQRSMSSHSTHGLDVPSRMLVSIEKIEQVPGVLSLVQLLQSSPGKPENIENGIPDAQKSERSTLHALRLLELTDRDSSVMLHSSEDALSGDPIMSTLSAYGQLLGALDIRGIAKVTPVNTFAKTLHTVASQLGVTRILVPWSGEGALIQTFSPAVFGEGNTGLYASHRRDRRPSTHTPAQHGSFIRDLLELGKSYRATVMILIDRMMEKENQEMQPNLNSIPPSIQNINNFQNVFLPFFGGADDRAALHICIEVIARSHPGIQVHITRFQNMMTRSSSSHKLSRSSSMVIDPAGVTSRGSIVASTHSGSGDNFHITSELSNTEILVSDAADKLMLLEYFGNAQAHSAVVINSNVFYNVVESLSPVTSAIQAMQGKPHDLIVMGRGTPLVRRSVDGGGGTGIWRKIRGASRTDRRKVLGDVAEALMMSQCTSSILVVQAGKLK